MRTTISQLENGLTVASAHMPDAHSVAVGVWIKAGSRDEADGLTGVAHFLEHMAFKGTATRDAAQIAREVEDVGGFMNAHTSREETAYYINLLPEHMELGVDILSDILTASTLPSHEIERERGVIIQEIGQSLDTPDDLVFELFNKACFGEHTLGQSILGTQETVSSFRQADLAGFMSRFYGSNQMIICAAGQLDHDRFAGLVRDRFSGVHLSEEPGRLTPSWQAGSNRADRDLEQTHTVFGFSAPGIRSAQRFDMMVLANLYGGGMSSRLFQKVREERGLCYSIFAFSQMLSDAGVFGVYAGTSQAQANEMLEVCAAELKDCLINISTDELSRSKQQLKAAVLMRLDSVSASLDSLARQIALFGEPRDKDEMIREIEAVSQDSLHALVAQLTTSRPAMATVGPVNGVMGTDALADLFAA
ncbi:MAG: M16 family metallopeptidase [Candidatus Puniceispirillaceae bacterium]|nr:pitrilysin family protein [Pseudomonadota bacterium]HCD62891.1 insulinase family protein [Alphaproteobacteria bacterium]